MKRKLTPKEQYEASLKSSGMLLTKEDLVMSDTSMDEYDCDSDEPSLQNAANNATDQDDPNQNCHSCLQLL